MTATEDRYLIIIGTLVRAMGGSVVLNPEEFTPFIGFDAKRIAITEYKDPWQIRIVVDK